MREYRVLIVEDDLLFASHLEAMIETTIAADIVDATSVAAARTALKRPVDVAFLDVEVLDGRTYELASDLANTGVPFAFVSASNRAELPPALRSVPFIVKPCSDADVRCFLAARGIPEEHPVRSDGFKLDG